VFSWSYRHLDADTARGFRLVGLHPGPDFDRDAVAALTGLTAAQAGALLTALARAHLIHATQPGRYGLHDLLRGYARELSADHDGEPAQKEALTRLFDYYLRTAGTAIDNLSRRPRDQSTVSAGGPAAALHWLQTERAVHAAVIAYTAQNGWPRHTIRLASILHMHLENGGHFLDAIAAHNHARRAAQLTGDPLAEADALDNLGRLAWLQGRQPQAIGLLHEALDLFNRSGEPSGQARVQVNLGITAGRQGHYEKAAGHLTEALQLFRRTGDLSGQAQALNNLGLIELFRGRYEPASVQLRAAYDLATEAGDRPRILISLNNLGLTEVRRGDCDRARAYLKRALALSVETGDRLIQAHVLATVGEVDLKQRRYRQALDNAERSRVLCTEIGDRYSQVTALNLVGEILLAMSRPAEARAQHTAALRLAVQIGNKYGQAAAHNGIACSCRASHDLRQARHHWEQALLRYDQLGSPEADRVRAHLAWRDATPSRNGPAPAHLRSTFAG
jgi:tetratricopeptide (TPR) repeat protein